MMTLAECAVNAGLGSNEVVLGSVKSKRHDALLASYLLNLHRGPATVRDMIVSDLRGFLDIGALNRAADALLVLRLFLSECPEARVRRERGAANGNEPSVAFSRPSGTTRRRLRNRFHAPATMPQPCVTHSPR